MATTERDLHKLQTCDVAPSSDLIRLEISIKYAETICVAVCLH